MAQLLVRDLDEEVAELLRLRAHRHGRSLEAEIRDILCTAAKSGTSAGGLGSDIAARFAGRGLAEDIAELRGGEIKPPSFG